jgi:uncharacterized protein (DUF2062 family)
MKPPIITLSPVCTKLRLLMLRSVANGVALGLGMAVAVGLGVAVAVGLGVAVAVAVGLGVGVGDGLTTVTVPTMPQHPPCGVQ